MPTSTEGALRLYLDLLGDRWDALSERVQRLHTPGATVRASGTFCVCRGANWLARLAATLAGLPAECAVVAVHLVVTPGGNHEEWRRYFGGRPFVSTQYANNGSLIERIGLSEVRFQLDVIDGALQYQSTRVWLRAGLLRLPLPRWLSPRLTASEKADETGVRVSVEVRVPLLGRLVAYDGLLTEIEAESC